MCEKLRTYWRKLLRLSPALSNVISRLVSQKLTQAASEALRVHLEHQLEEIDGSWRPLPRSRAHMPVAKRHAHEREKSYGVHIKLVQELLGHATISITLDTYSHLLPSIGGEATWAMERIFS